MVTLATALEAATRSAPRRRPREIAAIDFVTGNHANVLAAGRAPPQHHLPARALHKRFAFRIALAHPSRPLGDDPHRHRSADDSDLLLP